MVCWLVVKFFVSNTLKPSVPPQKMFPAESRYTARSQNSLAMTPSYRLKLAKVKEASDGFLSVSRVSPLEVDIQIEPSLASVMDWI